MSQKKSKKKGKKGGEAYKTKYGYLSITAEQRKELKRFELKNHEWMIKCVETENLQTI